VNVTLQREIKISDGIKAASQLKLEIGNYLVDPVLSQEFLKVTKSQKHRDEK
jgi:hypothetical protein